MPLDPEARAEYETRVFNALSSRTAYVAAAENSVRELHPSLAWARSMAGNPHGFIREIMGRNKQGIWIWDTADWFSWKVFVSAVFGLPMTETQRALFKQCTGMENPPTGFSKEVWGPIGRRGGKSRIVALIVAYMATCFDWSKYRVEGERGDFPVLAESKERAKQAFEYIEAAFRHPRLRWFVEGDPLSETIRLKGFLAIRVSVSSVPAAQSRTCIMAVCDEIASWKAEDKYSNPDHEVLEALRPSMVTIPESMLFCIGRPRARRGELWNNYREVWGRPWDGRRICWKAPTERMHPSLTGNDEIAAAYKRDPASAAAEYGAEFRADVASLLTIEALEACISVGVYERPYDSRHKYFGFVDTAGGSGSDSMALCIAHSESDSAVIDVLREWRPPFVPSITVKEAAGTLKAYKVREITGDRYGEEWTREQFEKENISYNVSDKSKSEIYLTWLPIVNSGRNKLLDNERFIVQATRLERHAARAARDSVDHPPDEHDDLANVVAGASVLAAGGRSIEISSELIAAVKTRLSRAVLIPRSYVNRVY